MSCSGKECDQCDVYSMKLLPKEESTDSVVIWRCHHYISTRKVLEIGQEQEKLALVTRETPPSEMLGYLKNLL